jgi:hypothetical protein
MDNDKMQHRWWFNTMYISVTLLYGASNVKFMDNENEWCRKGMMSNEWFEQQSGFLKQWTVSMNLLIFCDSFVWSTRCEVCGQWENDHHRSKFLWLFCMVNQLSSLWTMRKLASYEQWENGW